MGARVHFLKPAVSDVAGLIEFLSGANPGAASRFETALESAIRRVAEFPRIGHPVRSRNARLVGVRSWPVPGFPDIFAFYRLDGGRLFVVRVLHGARDLPVEFGVVLPHEEE